MFVFPSLEEGGPLVTYEALAAGLPAIVSPMGAGAVVRHEREGLVVDPHDTDALVAAMQHLIADATLRRIMGHNGIARAQQFTWEQVGQRRSRQLARLVARRSGVPAEPEPATILESETQLAATR